VNGYDVIGDIHGHADALERLLGRLGYVEEDGVFRHPDRLAVFAGDFVDRGPRQQDTLRIARAMVEAGTALAVMGNHEFNAIGWATPGGSDGALRAHTPKNHAQHRVFLEQVGRDEQAHADAIAWFRSLPLWLDLGGLRVVHACWHEPSRAALEGFVDDRARLTDAGLLAAHDRGSPAWSAAEVLLKGPEARLPGGCSFHDKDGNLRHEARLRWWDPAATSFRTAALGMEGRESEMPDLPVPAGFLYPGTVPVLFGHYWMRGEPAILNPLASCLDFSVAKGGVLTAYRWSGEPRLRADNLSWVPA
jgi:hypothetical protein